MNCESQKSLPLFACTLSVVLCLFAAGFLLAMFAVWYGRASFPFTLEWMEGAGYDHLRRWLDGKPLYISPSAEFTPFAYPPLFYVVSGLLSFICGASLFTMRLVSIISTCALLLLLRLYVRRETESGLGAIVAVGLFAATFVLSGAWLDLARVDALYLAFFFAAVYVARHAHRDRWGLGVALLLVLSFLTKQTALPLALCLCAALAVLNWRRALGAALGTFAGIAACVVALSQSSQGWFTYYVFKHPQQRWEAYFSWDRALDFWGRDLWGNLWLASFAALWFLVALFCQARYRNFLFHLMVAAGLVLIAWWTRFERNAFLNNLIPAHLALVWLAALGLGTAHTRFALSGRGSVLSAEPALSFLGLGFLLVGQFNALRYDPRALIPNGADWANVRQFDQFVRALGPGVVMPFRPYFPADAAPIQISHVHAVNDIFAADRGEIARGLTQSLLEYFKKPEVKVVILNNTDWYRSMPVTDYLNANFHRTPELESGPLATLWQHSGFSTRPHWVLRRNSG